MQYSFIFDGVGNSHQNLSSKIKKLNILIIYSITFVKILLFFWEYKPIQILSLGGFILAQSKEYHHKNM